MVEDELYIKYGWMAKRLKERLSPKRYRHSLGVAYTSASLAMCHNVDIEKAFLAGLLHDAAKYMTDAEYLEKAAEFSLFVSETEKASPGLLHAKLGAYLAEHEFGVKDPDVLNAIRYHTTGRIEMSLLEQIVCISDFIEPGRPTLPFIEEIRAAAFSDLDRACYYYSKRQIEFLNESGRPVDPSSEETMRHYERKINGAQEYTE